MRKFRFKFKRYVALWLKKKFKKFRRNRKKKRKIFWKKKLLIYVNCTANNTFIVGARRKIKKNELNKKYIIKGKTVSWISAGKLGFTKNKRSLPYAAQLAGIAISLRLKKKYPHIKTLILSVKGYGPGRYNAIKGLSMGFGRKYKYHMIKNLNTTVHNGCRSPKKRRK